MTDETKALLDEAARLDAEATAGPWETGDPEHPGAVWTLADGETLVASVPASKRWQDADTRHIARARTLLPEVCAALRECERELAEMQEHLDQQAHATLAAEQERDEAQRRLAKATEKEGGR